MLPALSDRFARNGGHGSIEESEILHLSPVAEGFGVISGCAFLHCKKGTKADLNMVAQEVCRFRRPEDVRADYDTSHVAQAGSTARLGGRQNRIQPLLGSCRPIQGTRGPFFRTRVATSGSGHALPWPKETTGCLHLTLHIRYTYPKPKTPPLHPPDLPERCSTFRTGVRFRKRYTLSTPVDRV